MLWLKKGFKSQTTKKPSEIGFIGTVGVGAYAVDISACLKPVFQKLTEAGVKNFLAL